MVVLNPIGDAGRSVAVSVATLRKGRGMSLRALSDALSEVGRPILPSGLFKLEHLDRRVDVDELVALAQVFNVSPNELLTKVTVCETCYGAPPAGFVCATCGTGGA